MSTLAVCAVIVAIVILGAASIYLDYHDGPVPKTWCPVCSVPFGRRVYSMRGCWWGKDTEYHLTCWRCGYERAWYPYARESWMKE